MHAEELERTVGHSKQVFAGDRHSKSSCGRCEWCLRGKPMFCAPLNRFGRLGAVLKQTTRADFSFHDLRATCATGIVGWARRGTLLPSARSPRSAGHPERCVPLLIAGRIL